MDRIILYHGSERIVEIPTYGKGDDHSDYGNGFYCTTEIYAAKEWANKKTQAGFANKYSFDGRGLKVLDLTDKNTYSVLNWFAILMHYREIEPSFKEDYSKELAYLKKHYFIDVEQFDVIIGYRADDSYFEFPKMFIKGDIRVERLENVYALGFLGVQIAILSKKAYQKLRFVEAIKAEPIYHDKYKARIDNANARLKEIAKDEKWREGTRIKDLVIKDDKY